MKLGPGASDVERIRAAYAQRRDAGGMSPSAAYVVDERRSILQRVVIDRFGEDHRSLRVLDVGCGTGGDLAFWRDRGVPADHLAGTELLAGPFAQARANVPEADIRLVDGFDLPWHDGAFDLTWSSMAFSSIAGSTSRRRLFSEMWRVTRAGGIVAIYDFHVRKPTNRNVVALNARRVEQLGQHPWARIRATPLLPILPMVLRMPSWVQGWLLRLLPRTHSVWVWARSPGVGADAGSTVDPLHQGA